MKGLLYTSLILSALVIFNELTYLGKTSLALVLIAISVAVILQAIYLIKKK